MCECVCVTLGIYVHVLGSQRLKLGVLLNFSIPDALSQGCDDLAKMVGQVLSQHPNYWGYRYPPSHSALTWVLYI